MNGINNALYSIAITAFTVGIINAFFSSSRLKKYIKYTTSLIIIIILLSNTLNAVTSAESSVEKMQNDLLANQDTDINQLQKPIIYAIEDSISQRFSIPGDCFATEIQTSKNNNQLIVEKINISITNAQYNYLAQRISAYIRSEFGCEAIVNQKI